MILAEIKYKKQLKIVHTKKEKKVCFDRVFISENNFIKFFSFISSLKIDAFLQKDFLFKMKEMKHRRKKIGLCPAFPYFYFVNKRNPTSVKNVIVLNAPNLFIAGL